MTSAALVLDEDPRTLELDLTVVGETATEARPAGSLQTRFALVLIIVVQAAWLATLGYAVLTFVH